MRNLTPRETEVLLMIGERLTVKEMAVRQGVSASAVNKRISTLKTLFQVNTQRALLDAYLRSVDHAVLSDSAWTINHLPEPSGHPLMLSSTSRGSEDLLKDSMPISLEHPFGISEEPRVVPRLLDGEGAGWNRGLAIMVATVLLLAAILIGLGVAQGLTEALHRA